MKNLVNSDGIRRKIMEITLINKWLVDGVRFTFFTTEKVLDHAFWWQSLAGSEPDSVVSRSLKGEFSYVGTLGNSNLELNIFPDRIDWILKTKPEEGLLEPFIGEYDTCVSDFVAKIDNWLNGITNIFNRFAFGVSIYHPVESKIDGYKEIYELLPFLPLVKGEWNDFFLQFNKQKTIVINSEEVLLNRIMNFGVAQMQFINIQNTTNVMSKLFTRIEFDINTHINNRNEFTSSEVKKIIPFLTDIPSALNSASEV